MLSNFRTNVNNIEQIAVDDIELNHLQILKNDFEQSLAEQANIPGKPQNNEKQIPDLQPGEKSQSVFRAFFSASSSQKNFSLLN